MVGEADFTVAVEGSTAAEADSTVAAEADFMVAEGDSTVAVEGSTVGEDFTAVAAFLADAAASAGVASWVAAGVSDAAALADAVSVGADLGVIRGGGALALGGRIGGDIPMATTATALGLMLTIIPTIILTTILPLIRILTTGATTLPPQVLAQGPTKTAPRNLGDLPYRTTLLARTTLPLLSRPMSLVLRLSQTTS